MTKIVWNEVGERTYEHGLDRGVFYPTVGDGVPWPGLISVDESVDGGELDSHYYDGVKYLDFVANEFFKAKIEAFSTPPGFHECDGSLELAPGLFATQQLRSSFGMSYRTLVGNDGEGPNHSYKIHLVYNAIVLPTSKTYKTVADSPEPLTLSYDVSTKPPASETFRPTAHFVIEVDKIDDPAKLQTLENRLYGTNINEPYLPTQASIINLLSS